MLNPEKTVLPSTKGEVSHGSCDADIHADISGWDFVAKFASVVAVRSEDGCGIAEPALGNGRYRLVEIRSRLHRKDGSEDLCIVELVIALNIRQDCRIKECV